MPGPHPPSSSAAPGTDSRSVDFHQTSGPVRFNPYTEEFFESPYAIYRRMRDEAPVYYSEELNFFALTRYDDVAPAYRDFATYSSARGVSVDMVNATKLKMPKGRVLIMMDPPEHELMRKLVNRVFTPRAVAGLEAMVATKIDSALARVDPRQFDVVSDFSALFPMEIIADMLGVPTEDRNELRRLLDKGLERQPGQALPTRESIDAMIASGTYYFELVQKRRRQPQDDMISRLIDTEVIECGEARRLDDVEIAGFANMLGGAGAETVTKLIGNAIVVFAEHLDQWRRLRTDRDKVPAAFEELLRFEGPSQYNVRYSLKEVTLHGRTIPQGSAVMLINGAANRDERAFPDPDRFDIDRERKVGFNLGFGYGIHSCLGAALARMEGRIALNALLDRLPDFEVDSDGLKRVNMTNVIGWSHVPVHAL
ncbi:Putative cytochrome P450 123 [Mycolicibacterium vanbaalenii]|uniref:Steroid C26-monooxygenase n=1 Tax=Mycolicibacterium vanbaalenii TaxID=110539 RepID=A0A5S9NLS0_MYCVN|nr:cytochrome P450 [Mycolicibacterium vanbaalenii]CAA0091686.1 Putative cytochrome P450 123 [Mycolicibacterium vanbaalenii]